MRAFNQGAFIRVTVSKAEVEQFKWKWPCSELQDNGYSFTFDRRNGDLVDIGGRDETEYYDDGPALAALSQDAQAYAKARGLLA